MQPSVATQILKRYSINLLQLGRAEGGYRSTVYPFQKSDRSWGCLLFYKAEPGILQTIRTAHRLSSHLTQQGFPVRQTIDNRITKIVSENTTTYACLYNYLPGKTIAWESYHMDHIKLLGKTLARLHSSACDLPQGQAKLTKDLALELLTRMQAYFDNTGAHRAIKQKLNVQVVQTVFSKAERLLQTDLGKEQLIHMDFVRGNILFDTPRNNASELQEGTARISGILDFEKVSFGAPLHDIARTLAFLYVDCKYKTETQVHKYFITSGYEKRGEGTITNYKSLEALVSFYLLHDFYKFLKHNPYESLFSNEHFVRTRDILIRRSVLEKL